MKLKYFIRGIGVGVLVTTILLSINFALNPKKMSDEDIKKRATQLGMVMKDNITGQRPTNSEEQTKKPTEEATKVPEEIPTDAPTKAPEETPTDAPTEAPTDNQTQAVIYIPSGMNSSLKVCQMLQEAGAIENAVDFNRFLEEKKYDVRIRAGEKKISFGLSYEEIAKILMSS